MDKKGLILVVDDDKETASGLKGLLNGIGHDVLTVLDKNEAIKTIDAISFDVIVLEVDIIDGVEVLKHIRAKKPKTKVIIYSKCDYKMKKEAEEIGIDEFLPKKVEISMLLDAVQSVLK